jgi:hypothetical protein
MRPRILALGWLTLGACVAEHPARVPAEPSGYAAPKLPPDARLGRVVDPSNATLGEGLDAQAEVRSWLACHPYEVARFEFGPGEDRVTSDASKAELERLVARLLGPGGPDGPIPHFLIMGWRSPEEHASLDDLRAGGIRLELMRAGAPPLRLSAAGFDVRDEFNPLAHRAVTVLEVCDVCCIL